MNRIDEKRVAIVLVALVVVLNAIVLAPELTIGRVDLNDSVFHSAIAESVATRVAEGRSALDFWMPEWSLGYPVLRAYQPLPAWLLATVHLATGRAFPFDQTFAFVRWLLIAIFPLSVYAAARMLTFRPMTAAAAAIVAPLVASPNLYGLEYGSYLWRGNGVFTQLVAMHFFVLAIGAAWRAVRTGRGVTLAGLLVALTLLSHFIYGYMAAVTVALIAILPAPETPLRRRIARLVWIGVLSAGLTAFQLVPMLRDGAFINRSRWEPSWKWDSFGLKQVLVLVATGEIVDSQRLPMIATFALIGTIVALRRRRAIDDEQPARTFAIAGALLWIFFFAGPLTWGPLLKVLGVGDEVQAHRFIGGLHFFLILLAGAGLDFLWSIPQRNRWRHATLASVAIAVALLAFPVSERLDFMHTDEKWGRDNLARYEQYRPDIDRVIDIARRRGGRAYPGLAATWGNQFKIGYVPFHAFLSRAHVPAVAFLYHAMSLPSDLMVRFDETRPAHYRLFDIRSIVAEAGRTLPQFLVPIETAGVLRVLQPPSQSSAFDLVNVPYSAYVDRRNFYDVNDAWLQSGWVDARQHLLLDYESAVPVVARPRVDLTRLRQAVQVVTPGAVLSESVGHDEYRAAVDATSNCFAMLKSTYHPRWRAEVDGREQRVVMVSPGFAAVEVAPGRHAIRFHYEHGWGKTILLVLALPLLVISFFAERRGVIGAAESRLDAVAWNSVRARELAWIALVVALTLPCIAALLSSAETSGHDALEYIPRLVEFHENIRSGILLPRWAPDLSSGQGQPLFVVNPPLFYYIADVFHVLGLALPAAINAACALLVIASALSMYLLAKHWFGRAGAIIGAVAYVYAPYFLVDMYVRAALAELTAFPFYPLTLYGFSRYASEWRVRDLLIGGAAYAAIFFAHTPAAVLFTPLLGVFLIYLAWRERSVRVFLMCIAGAALGLALAAAIWVPGVVEASDTNSQRLTVGALQYSNHFVYPRQFFSTMWGYGLSVAGAQDGMPFTLGWAHMLIAAIAAIVLWRRGDRRLTFFAAALFAVCYLMTPRSHAIWDAIPQLHYVAFPWRLLADAIVCLAILVAASAIAIERRIVAVGIVTVLILANVGHARPQSYLTIDLTEWTPNAIASRGVIPSTFDTFEPRWVQTRPVYTGNAIAVNSGSATSSVIQRTPVRFVAIVNAVSASEIELPIAYFPGWHVTVDGYDATMDTPSAMGRMRLGVDRGSHRVEARFERTPVRLAAELTSAFALLLVVGVVSLLFASTRRRKNQRAKV